MGEWSGGQERESVSGKGGSESEASVYFTNRRFGKKWGIFFFGFIF